MKNPLTQPSVLLDALQDDRDDGAALVLGGHGHLQTRFGVEQSRRGMRDGEGCSFSRGALRPSKRTHRDGRNGGFAVHVGRGHAVDEAVAKVKGNFRLHLGAHEAHLCGKAHLAL